MSQPQPRLADDDPQRPAPAPAPVRRPIMRQYELVERVKAYDPGVDEDLLNRAYVFAMKAHGAQRRASGDPYFSHPVEVAGILAGLKLDSASIATGLLHDTVEDTGATLADIERLFGREIGRLVDGVTKLNKLELQSDRTEQAENFRKLLLAMSEDIRVLLVKLADRLHNMRTLHFVPSRDKRRRIARETREIYAPLAERIGMQGMRDELEDLAFAELWPDGRESVTARLAQLREHDGNLIERIVEELRRVLREEGVDAEVYGREKTPFSIWHKMRRKNVAFEQLSDIMAFRIMVGTLPACYAALGAIHGRYAMVPERFKDYISTPKPNGYRSLHTTIIGPERRRIEVQIRTREMHEVAELGVAAHWAYKEDRRLTHGRQYRWIRELLEILEHASGPEEFLENTKLEMFQDQVFCFTPKGDLIALPRGATPVDFAYAVHSEVGDACVGAKVNGRMVQLRTPLNNGDQVEIITGKGGGPSAAWERFVVTGKARARIRRWRRTQKRGEYVALGRAMLQRAARREHVELTDRVLQGALAACRQKTVDDLLAAVGEASLAPRQVLDALFPAAREARSRRSEVPAPGAAGGKDTAEVLPLRRTAPPPPASAATAAPLRGLTPGLAVRYARCCCPVPGDPIVGIVRTGQAVSIHTRDCANLSRYADEPERWLEVGWNDGARDASAVARLHTMAMNKPGSLGALSTVVGKHGGNIVDLKFGRRSNDLFEIVLDVEVGDVGQLGRIIAALRATPVVTSVERARS
ncbi:MAG TPA: bifunctional (p)ppGpp synthetase/guanosine-3',5'-bis(diphosphate) 3'-pyrophosphohydrolase [Geminicoccaceae bacterium]|nr:bifunctional (p)ppGpp synthetase/guanosine-3',5'-bis(diphosphate) 3'-pyrophosphohydrolase [Geminicoccaceae bacterium]